MRPQVLLAAALVVLVASARAQTAEAPEEPEEQSILGVMQNYVHHATKKAQDAFNSVQNLQVAEQARGWMSNRMSTLQDYWSSFTDTFTGFWELSEDEADPTPLPQPTPEAA